MRWMRRSQHWQIWFHNWHVKFSMVTGHWSATSTCCVFIFAKFNWPMTELSVAGLPTQFDVNGNLLVFFFVKQHIQSNANRHISTVCVAKRSSKWNWTSSTAITIFLAVTAINTESTRRQLCRMQIQFFEHVASSLWQEQKLLSQQMAFAPRRHAHKRACVCGLFTLNYLHCLLLCIDLLCINWNIVKYI